MNYRLVTENEVQEATSLGQVFNFFCKWKWNRCKVITMTPVFPTTEKTLEWYSKYPNTRRVINAVNNAPLEFYIERANEMGAERIILHTGEETAIID
jgi:hypothetical protein